MCTWLTLDAHASAVPDWSPCLRVDLDECHWEDKGQDARDKTHDTDGVVRVHCNMTGHMTRGGHDTST